MTALKLIKILFLLGLLSLTLSQPATVLGQDKPPELNLQTSHQGRINAVAVSPDGRTIASGGADHTIKIWDAERGIVIRTLEGHSGQVFSLAFSRDGSTLISGSQDHTIVFWDAKSGHPLRTFKDDPRFSVTGVAPGYDNQSLISVSRLGEEFTNGPRLPDNIGDVRVWDLNTGKPIRSLKTNGMCDSLAAAQDGSLVYCVTGEIWDPRSGKLVSNEYRLGHANQAAFSPSGNLLAIVNFYGLDIWDVKRLSAVHLLHDLFSRGDVLYAESHQRGLKARELQCLAFSPDGRLIAAGDNFGWASLWEAESGKSLGAVQAHPGEVTSIAFSPDGNSLVTAGIDSDGRQQHGTVRIWDVANDHIGAARNPETNTASATASAASSGPPKADITAHAIPVSAVTFSPDGQLLAAGGADNLVRIWNLQNGSFRTLEGHTREIRSLSFSPDSKKIVSATDGSEGSIRLWDARTGALLHSYDAFAPYSVAFHPDGRTIVSNGMSDVIAWDAAGDSKSTMSSNHSVHEGGFVAVSPSGKIIASLSAVLKSGYPNYGAQIVRYTITLFDRDTRKDVRVLFGHVQPITSAVFSPDGQTLVSGGKDSNLKVWDVNDGHLVRTLSGHTAAIRSVAYSPNGAMIASGSEDRSVKLWEAKTGRLLQTLTEHTAAVTSVSFGPEGMTVAAGGADGTIQIWSTQDGSPQLNLRGFEGRQWIAYTPHGYYASSDGHANYITWRIGNAVYDADQFFEKFYTPDLLLRVFQGKIPAPPAETRTVAPPPDVLIVSPRPGQVLTEPDIQVSLEVKDLGGGVDEVRLFQNGKLLSPQTGVREVTPVDQGGGTRRYKVTLLEGQNVLRATAFSSDRTESKPHEITVELRAPKKVAALRLLAVGVSRYKNPALTLTYPKADADGVVSFFKTTGSRLFREVDVTELSDEAATEANILQALLSLRRRALPEDVVIVFLAGHGGNFGSQWYFIPHDLTSPENDSDLAAHGMSSARLSQELKSVSSLKTILLVDACYAGSMLTAFRGYEDRKALALLGRSAGVHIMAASARDQHASEVAELGHGVFSYALLKGLNGEAVLRTAEKSVTVLGLMSYIRDQLPDLGKKYGIEIQDPVSYSNGMDFPVVVLP